MARKPKPISDEDLPGVQLTAPASPPPAVKEKKVEAGSSPAPASRLPLPRGVAHTDKTFPSRDIRRVVLLSARPERIIEWGQKIDPSVATRDEAIEAILDYEYAEKGD